MVAALADPQLIIKTNKKPVIKIGIFVLELIFSPLKIFNLLLLASKK
jgi:hypothetical protein